MRHRGWAASLLLVAAVGAIAFYWTTRNPAREPAVDDLEAFATWARSPAAAALPELERLLAREKVGDILPMHEILRGDIRRKSCMESRFAVPPRDQWPRMVPTLRYLRDHVIPVVGPLRAVSGYRDPSANQCAGGASGSRHLRFSALDLEPVTPLARAELVERLCSLHRRTGARFAVGLGVYKGQRFHIDTSGFRSWGSDFRAASSPCFNNS